MLIRLSSEDRNRCISFLQDIVRIPSLSGQEGEVASRIAQEMKAVGFHDVHIDAIGNVIGRIGDGSGKLLLLDGHMDTVAPGDLSAWEHDPFGAEIVDGVLYGRGSMDMKGSLAAMIYGAKALLDSGVQLAGDLYLAIVVQEEPSEGVSIKALMENEGLKPDFVIVGEPSGLNISPGHRGRVAMEVNVHGRSCHASSPEEGVNAIYSAARMIFSIELLPAQFLTDPLLGSGSISVTGIKSIETGSRNVIPDLCTFIVDRRLTLGETVEKALSEIQQVIVREGADAEVRVVEYDTETYTGYKLHVKEAYPAWLMQPDHPLVKAAMKGASRALGVRPKLVPWRFSTDGAYTMGVAGIPTIGFGPGEERLAHTANEHIRIADVLKAAEAYAYMAVEILGESR
jgi:putative selenium metabolism hydrolase